MARKRMIDPGIWADTDFATLTDKRKLLFIGSFSWADDEGRGDATATNFKLKVFPADSISYEEIEEAKTELDRKELLVLYDTGTKYFLPKWYRVQAVPKPSQSNNPLPPKDLLLKFPEYIIGFIEQYRREDWEIPEVFYEITELLPNHYRTITERLLPKLKEVKGSKVKGSKVKEYIRQSRFFFSIKHIEEFTDTLLEFKDEDSLLIELKKMTSWLVANPTRQKKDYRRFIVNWLNRDKKGESYGNTNQGYGKAGNGENRNKDSKYGHLSKTIE